MPMTPSPVPYVNESAQIDCSSTTQQFGVSTAERCRKGAKSQTETQEFKVGVSGDSILQPYSAMSGMLVASMEEKSSWKSEQTWIQEREGVQAVSQNACMESSHATQEFKGGVSGGGTIFEEGRFTSLDFAGSEARSIFQPYSTAPFLAPCEPEGMDVRELAGRDDEEVAIAMSGMRVAPIEQKSSWESEQIWTRERDGVQAVPQYVCMESSNATSLGFAGNRVGGSLQPYSTTSAMRAASAEEQSSWKSEQTWSEERDGVETVPLYVCMESSNATQELGVRGANETLQREGAHHWEAQNNGGVFMEVITEIIGDTRDEERRSLFDGEQATTGAPVEERVAEGSRFGYEFPPSVTGSVSHAAPLPISPRKIDEANENIEVVAWSRERGGAMPMERGGFESSFECEP